MCDILPGILEKDWEAIEKRIELAKPFAKAFHVDLLDGKFAPNTTFMDPAPFKKYSNDFFLELHMMVEEPIQYLKPFADVGFKRFVGHIENMSDQAAFVAEGQMLGEVGLAIDGKTSLDALKVPLEDLDTVLVMTINAGFSGQAFMPEHLEKVKELRKRAHSLVTSDGKAFPIEIDGGVNDQTITLALEAGANRFVATSFLFKSDDAQKQYNLLKRVC